MKTLLYAGPQREVEILEPVGSRHGNDRRGAWNGPWPC